MNTTVCTILTVLTLLYCSSLCQAQCGCIGCTTDIFSDSKSFPLTCESGQFIIPNIKLQSTNSFTVTTSPLSDTSKIYTNYSSNSVICFNSPTNLQLPTSSVIVTVQCNNILSSCAIQRDITAICVNSPLAPTAAPVIPTFPPSSCTVKKYTNSSLVIPLNAGLTILQGISCTVFLDYNFQYSGGSAQVLGISSSQQSSVIMNIQENIYGSSTISGTIILKDITSISIKNNGGTPTRFSYLSVTATPANQNLLLSLTMIIIIVVCVSVGLCIFCAFCIITILIVCLTEKGGRSKSMFVAYFLWFFFGYLGIHRFYLNRPCSGIIFLFTGGIFGIGWLIDLCLIPSMVAEENKITGQQVINVATTQATQYYSAPLLESDQLNQNGVKEMNEVDINVKI